MLHGEIRSWFIPIRSSGPGLVVMGRRAEFTLAIFVTFHFKQPLLFHDLASPGNPVRASDGLKRSPQSQVEVKICRGFGMEGKSA